MKNLVRVFALFAMMGLATLSTTEEVSSANLDSEMLLLTDDVQVAYPDMDFCYKLVSCRNSNVYYAGNASSLTLTIGNYYRIYYQTASVGFCPYAVTGGYQKMSCP